MRWLTSPASRLGAGFRRRGQQRLPVRVLAENGLAPVAPIHHVINRSGILNSQLARHDQHYPGAGASRQLNMTIPLTDPFPLEVRRAVWNVLP